MSQLDGCRPNFREEQSVSVVYSVLMEHIQVRLKCEKVHIDKTSSTMFLLIAKFVAHRFFKIRRYVSQARQKE